MRTSIEWLTDFLPAPLDAHACGEALTHGGLPVEIYDRVGDDTVIDVEITSNRGDCLSHRGVARELAALLNLPLKQPEIRAAESATGAASVTSVQITAPDLCPHYTARILRNVRVGPSPAWMVRRLEAVGLRAINNIVDITNYVMFELGQPLHAFDFDKLGGKRIIVRRAVGGERLTSIDGKARNLTTDMLVIADDKRPVALAGVMGGLDSEVSAATTSILLESARFDPLSVRKTARALAMKSDSSYRFERQIDPLLPALASLRAAQLMVEFAGAELLSGIVEAGSHGHSPRSLTLRYSKLKQVLGVELPPEDVIGALRRLNLQPVPAADGSPAVRCTIPSYRLDLNIEVDLVEEVARVVGYSRIPTRDEISIRTAPADPDAASVATIRQTLVSAGYFESLTFGFLSDALKDDFVPPEAAGLLRADPNVRADNARLRTSILPGLLESVRHNESNGTLGARLFEIGNTYWLDAAGKPDERRRLALVGTEDYREIRGAVEELLSRLDDARPVAIAPAQRPGFAKGACGQINWGDQVVGWIGRIDGGVTEKLSLRQQPCAAELDLSALLAGAQHVPQLKPLPKFPPVRRDLSLVVSEQIAYGRIDALLRDLCLPDLESLEYVTTYRGKPLEKGTKSVTVTLVFRSTSTTLTSEAVESAVQQAIATAKAQLGATLRV